ncbi:serine hydrolase [Streptomyces sp. PA5.6]|uniref:serine hydrolase n=1 Tax=Streptomyces sp. PA5.6 TaxID=3035651 RepID=UPI003904CB61
MHRFGSLALLLVLTPAFAGCSHVRTGAGAGGEKAARGVSASPERVDPAVDRFLDGALPKGPGITVTAARGDVLGHCAGRGLADRAARTPATCDTVYDVMSITKQFTAAAVLKLEMAGELRVTDRIDRYLGPVPEER